VHKRQIYSILLRLVAVWLVLVNFSATFDFAGKKWGHLLEFGPLVTLFTAWSFVLVIVLVLLFFSKKYERWFLRSIPGVESADASQLDDWFVLGCSLLGLWQVANVLPQLIINACLVFANSDAFSSAIFRREVFFGIIKFLFGIGLVIGSKEIRRIIRTTHRKGD